MAEKKTRKISAKLVFSVEKIWNYNFTYKFSTFGLKITSPRPCKYSCPGLFIYQRLFLLESFLTSKNGQKVWFIFGEFLCTPLSQPIWSTGVIFSQTSRQDTDLLYGRKNLEFFYFCTRRQCISSSETTKLLLLEKNRYEKRKRRNLSKRMKSLYIFVFTRSWFFWSI